VAGESCIGASMAFGIHGESEAAISASSLG
jgi:hypothetical protein